MSYGSRLISKVLKQYRLRNNLDDMSYHHDRRNIETICIGCRSCRKPLKENHLDEPMREHVGGYRDNALAVNVAPAKPIAWHRRWWQIVRAQKITFKTDNAPAIPTIIVSYIIGVIIVTVGYILDISFSH